MHKGSTYGGAVATQRASDAVVEQLQALILSGQLAPGQLLPSERDLAASAAVSRSMVREALKILGQRGLVETRQGSGSRVASPNSDSLSSAVEIVLRRGGLSFDEICDARALIEPEMAARAALRRSPSDVEELQRIVDRLDDLRSAPEDHIVADLKFHHMVARTSGHGLFFAISDAINGPVADAMRVGTKVRDAIEQSDEQHREIAHSIVSADADRARAAMSDHIAFVRSYLTVGEVRGPM